MRLLLLVATLLSALPADWAAKPLPPCGRPDCLEQTELAGRSLDAYPRFEHVATFNESDTVRMVVDPARLPEVAGVGCDVYVVKPRDRAEWDADGTLSEVRPVCPVVDRRGVSCAGGAPPCRCRFADPRGAGGIEDFVVELAAPFTLSSAAPPCFSEEGEGSRETRCIGLGAGYDVVLDCDRNGRLGPGDRIDGYGDEPGFYLAHDTTRPGVSAACVDYEIEGMPDAFKRQRTWFPQAAEEMDALPLVVISHGRGHMWNWYGYLQRHLASYGYVVMSHQNQTACLELPYPGCSNIEAASETTLRHADALLDLLLDPQCTQRVDSSACPGSTAPPAGLCALAGRIDPTRIVLVGHSRGGNGVVWAYDRLVSGDFVADHFGAGDIALVSSMAPTNALVGSQPASPLDVPYHLIWGAADNDVAGKAIAEDSQAFQIFERADGPRQSVYVHGVGHGWFHDDCAAGGDPGCDFVTGPADLLIGQTATHLLVKGYYLPLLEHYVRGNVAARDFLWRPWTSFRPDNPALDPASDPNIVVALEYRDASHPQVRVIDDHQSNPLPAQSSSGAAVEHNLAAGVVVEGDLQDADCTFDWMRPMPSPGSCGCWGTSGACRLRCDGVNVQPMNGMTRGSGSRGVVLEWTDDGVETPYYAYRIPPGDRDFSSHAFLSLRAAQTTRHPLTLADPLAELDFSIVLVDGDGDRSAISTGAYGAGIVTPYPRKDPLGNTACTFGGQCGVALCCPQGCDPFFSGVGWQSAFETVRVRLSDFTRGRPELDLDNVEELRFEFDVAPAGRLAFDDVELVME